MISLYCSRYFALLLLYEISSMPTREFFSALFLPSKQPSPQGSGLVTRFLPFPRRKGLSYRAGSKEEGKLTFETAGLKPTSQANVSACVNVQESQRKHPGLAGCMGVVAGARVAEESMIGVGEFDIHE